MQTLLLSIVALTASLVVAQQNSCDGALTPTTTWKKDCAFDVMHSTGGCWSGGRFPNETDTVLFPAGSNATVNSTGILVLNFTLFSVGSIIVEAGATLNVVGGAVQVLHCYQVAGVTNIYPDANIANQSTTAPTVMYLEDPGQPEGTDCRRVPVGFTPRVCGPGLLRVQSGGLLYVQGEYASTFITVVVDKGAAMRVDNLAFVWGNVTNNGMFTTSSGPDPYGWGFIYMHGFLFNNNEMTLKAAITFDKWATKYVDSPSLVIENRGLLSVQNNLYTTEAMYNYTSREQYEYTATLINYNIVVFTGYWTQEAINTFNMYNYGNITFLTRSVYDDGSSFYCGGLVVNHGFFIADGVGAYFAQYHSIRGHIVTLNGGSIYFGYGSVDVKRIKLCHSFDDEDDEDRQDETNTAKDIHELLSFHLDGKKVEDAENSMIAAKALTEEEAAAKAEAERTAFLGEKMRLLEANKVRHDAERMCWMYLDFCYPFPYELQKKTMEDLEIEHMMEKPIVRKKKPVLSKEKSSIHSSSVGKKLGVIDKVLKKLAVTRNYGVKVTVEKLLSLKVVTPVQCAQNPLFSLQDSVIHGDGTGSLLTTTSVDVTGTLRIGSGAKWYAMTEHDTPAAYGGGKITVADGGAIYLGISMDLNAPGSITVESGGMLAIPKFYKVLLSNYTIAVRKGGVLHVDGTLVTNEFNNKAVNCGFLRGRGTLTKGKAEDFTC